MLGAMLFFFLFTKKPIEGEEIQVFEPTPEGVRNFVTECLRQTANKGISYLGQQSGYRFINPDMFVTESIRLGIFYDKGKIIIPSLNNISNNFAGIIENSIWLCLDDFKSFQGLNITAEGEPSAQATIGKTSATVDLAYPIIVHQRERKTEYKTFSATISVRFGYALEVAQEIVQKFKENPDELDFNYLNSFDDVEISLFPYNRETLIFALEDQKSIIDGSPFLLGFAVKRIVNNVPELRFIPDFSIDQGNIFEYNISAIDVDGDALTYYNPDNNVKINPNTGQLTFNANLKGDYAVELCVKDPEQAFDCETINLMVK